MPRLSTEQRRAQLLEIGAELFASRPYDEVWIEEVAQIAQISRGLLYHYFPAKRDFFLEVVRHEQQRLLDQSKPDPKLPPLQQLAAGLDVYISYAESHPRSYRVVHRAASGSDEQLLAIRAVGLQEQQDRVMAGLALLMTPDDATAFVVRGWFAYVVALTLDWLQEPVVDRVELREVCVRTLLAAVGLNPANLDSESGLPPASPG